MIKSHQQTGRDGKDPEVGWMKGNMEWILGANSALLLLFLLVGRLCIPVEEKLGSNEAVA